MNALIVCVCISEILSVAASMYFPALLPNFQAEWALTNTEAGWISGIYFGGYAASVPILVSLTDRVDPRKIYLFSGGLGAVSLMGFGLMARGTWTATAFHLLAGISFAGTYMPGVKALSDRISGAKQSRAISFYTASIGVGTALSSSGQRILFGFPAGPPKPFSHRLYVRICGPLLGTFRLPFVDGGVYVFQSEPATPDQF
jgi:MFS family permease